MAAGRPKKKMELTKRQFAVIRGMYSDGASNAEVRAYIADEIGSCSNDLWARWMKEEPNFSEAIKNGQLFSQAHWEKMGRTNLTNGQFNYTGWYMNMKNRFGWRDKQEIETNQTHTINWEGSPDLAKSVDEILNEDE